MSFKNYKIKTTEGIETVRGQKFSFYIDGYRYWFFYHKPGLYGHSLRISELETGLKVLDVTYSTRKACLSDDKAACKMELTRLCEKMTAKKVREIIEDQKKTHGVIK